MYNKNIELWIYEYHKEEIFLNWKLLEENNAQNVNIKFLKI